jgi:hypothetical protein
MPLSFLLITWILGAAVFVPLLVIALVRFATVPIAFAVAAAFSAGAMAGFFLSLVIVSLLIPAHSGTDMNMALTFLFASAGAIGGAAIALALLRKFVSDDFWRRR